MKTDRKWVVVDAFYITDPKIILLHKTKEGRETAYIFLWLICLAGQDSEKRDGVLDKYTLSDISTLYGNTEKEMETHIKKLANIGLIDFSDHITINKWDKYQTTIKQFEDKKERHKLSQKKWLNSKSLDNLKKNKKKSKDNLKIISRQSKDNLLSHRQDKDKIKIRQDKDNNNININTKTSTVFSDVEQVVGQPLSMSQVNAIEKWQKLYKHSDSTIVEIFKYCKEYKNLNVKYVNRIAESWYEDGIKKIEDLNKSKPKKNNSKRALDRDEDYDAILRDSINSGSFK